jgi:TonB family protein
MFTKTTLTAILVSACAATQPMSTFPEHRSGTHLELHPTAVASDATQQVFPRIVGDAEIPSAQHLNTALLATQDKYEIGVRICVSPSGAVSNVELQQSSGVAELDRAALHDIRAWQYEQFPGPATLQTCAPMTLSYAP